MGISRSTAVGGKKKLSQENLGEMFPHGERGGEGEGEGREGGRERGGGGGGGRRKGVIHVGKH